MGFVEKRGKRYRARYRAPNGKEISKTFDRRTDADRFISVIEADKARGLWVDPALGRTEVADWSERWMRSMTHLKPKTRAGYESLLRCHVIPKFRSTPIAQVGQLDVQAWVSGMQSDGLSPSRIRQAKQVLGALMKTAHRSGYIARDPTEGIRLPRETPREMRCLTADQVESLAFEISAPYVPLVYVLSYGGLRWGEAVALRRKHVRLERSRLEIAESMAEVGGQVHFGPTKNYERRSVAIPGFLVDMFRKQFVSDRSEELERLVFRSPTGAVLRHSNFRRRFWLPTVARADVPNDLRIHELRHTCVSLLIAEGAHPKVIQHHVGHSSITVTMDRYGHLYPSEMDAFAIRLGEQQRLARMRLAASSRPASAQSLIHLPRDAG